MNWFKRLFGGQPVAPLTQKTTSKNDGAANNMKAHYAHLYRPAVHLRPDKSSRFSRLGGLPDLPANMEWPKWNEKPLAFLAQLDLSEIHRALPSFLPSSGYLYFFYDQDQSVWGFDPKDIGGWRVLYHSGSHSDLQKRPSPVGLPEEFVYKTKSVSAHRIDLLPDLSSIPNSNLEPAQDSDKFIEFRYSAFGSDIPHQVLGYPSPVQNGDMEVDCQLAANGIYVGSPEGYKDPRVAELKAGAADWKFLFQIDSDDDIGWMWGDVGMLYFWIRESDAKRGDFSKVWMVFQCC